MAPGCTLGGQRGHLGLLLVRWLFVPCPTAEIAREFPSGLADWQCGGASVSSPGCLPLPPLQTYPLPNWELVVPHNYLTEPFLPPLLQG